MTTTIYRGSDTNPNGRYWTTDLNHARYFGAVTERIIDLSDYELADKDDLSSCRTLIEHEADFREVFGIDEEETVLEAAQNIVDAGGYPADDVCLWIASRTDKNGVAFESYEGVGLVILEAA